MKKLAMIMAVAGLILVVNSVAQSAVTVELIGGNAGNVYSSGSSYGTWWANAQEAMRDGSTTKGTGNGTFTRLSPTGGISDRRPAYEALATGFDSWQGVAGGTSEYGHRVHFVYYVKATAGESLSLSKIKDIEIFEDGWGDTDYPIYASFYGSAVSFDSNTIFVSEKRVGYAADGTAVTSGTAEDWDAANPTNKIAEIVGNFGMAYAVYYGTGEWYYQDGDTKQDTLNRAVADIEGNLDNWNGVLTYDSTVVDTTVQFVPEPATMCLLALGGLALIRKRRKA